MRKMFLQFVASPNAATAVEYGLLAGLIAVAIISGVSLTGATLSSTFSTVAVTLK